ncbi:ABC transporter transmembrane domain-containing protein [Ferrimonas lipolytica]|uniref:ATP-binding cassette domain-containing protein n=1 Tax=Ferrimonas lipolytica TaxID=2724191 RepID=A0A6H1UEK0_9GAMM|nr:ABC transporter transmembrane domain-containing protein [Ferrimonas lipolytica]QIZ76222.1 ATP-binding cassette domain-containing protein [Ferrimonas lipolytica]
MTSSHSAVLPWILSLLVPYRRQVVIAAIALFTGSLSWLALGQGIKILVDHGFTSAGATTLNQVMMGILGLSLISGLAAYFRFYFMTWLGERISADIRRNVYRHVLSLPLQFFEKTKTGELISRFTSDTTIIQNAVGMSLSMVLRSSVTIVGGIVMMLASSPALTGYVLVVVPLVLVPIKVLGAKVRRHARASQDRVADIGAYVDESLHAIHTVQSYVHEPVDQRRFEQGVDAVLTAAAVRIRYRSLLVASVMTLTIAAITLVAWFGAHEVLLGSLSAGELSAFLFYALITAGAVATVSEVLGEVQRASGAGERLLELLNSPIPSRISDNSGINDGLPAPVNGQITLTGVRFAYPSAPTKAVIDDLSLTVAAGERIALVGPSGAGKSTMFQLLQQFYQPQQGSICLDGIDLSGIELAELRRQYALVPQDPTIFADSALENIRYGRPEATELEVRAAAKAAHADEFIELLSDGYNTNLGERGVRLSGGQRQRIAIARALLADRPILLLDEATSALDANSEHKVQQALEVLLQNKTSVIIAHRLATVINADRIVVMDKGRIHAVGTHQQLLQQSDLYRQYAELQLVS